MKVDVKRLKLLPIQNLVDANVACLVTDTWKCVRRAVAPKTSPLSSVITTLEKMRLRIDSAAYHTASMSKYVAN